MNVESQWASLVPHSPSRSVYLDQRARSIGSLAFHQVCSEDRLLEQRRARLRMRQIV